MSDKALKHRINAGKVAVMNQVEFFHGQFAAVPSEWKEDETRVTFADFAISEKLFIELRASFPKDHYCSEESNPLDEEIELTGRFSWILDPIDGTNNYALGVPFCAISLALLDKGYPVYGFIYDMSRRRLLHGGPGLGVYDGKRKMGPPFGSARQKTSPKHSRRPSLIKDNKEPEMTPNSLVGIHFPLDNNLLSILTPLLQNHKARSTGSAALNLAYTAIGIFDGCFDHNVKVWDIAAGWALMEAAGGAPHALGNPVFPLERFHACMPTIRYYAGSQSFCQLTAALLKDKLPDA